MLVDSEKEGEAQVRGPIVSIVIPAYNVERYIRRSVESALGQSHENLEIVVVDDGSKDSTAEIVKSYEDPRIVYVYQENRGQGAARNNGIGRSKGKYITFLDADDMYLLEKVEKQVRFLEEHPEYKIVYCNALHFYSDEPKVLLKKKCRCPSGDIFGDLLRSSVINPNTMMVHREVIERGFLFGEGVYGRYSEEWELYLRMSRAGFEFGYIDEDLVIVEIRKDSNTQWDKQWVIKKNTIEMLENISSEMSNEERAKYGMGEILRQNKLKLAIAYLIAGEREAFGQTISQVCSRAWTLTLLSVLIRLVPQRALRALLIKLWVTRQKKSFVRVDARSMRGVWASEKS
jgi:glycosyltransferase involved in cell wall biosynthesis